MKRLVFPIPVVVLALSGCYAYVPAQIETLPPGESARIWLSNEGRLEASEVTQRDAPVISGTLTRHDAQQAFFRVRISTVQEGALFTPVLTEVPISMRNIIQLERRQLSRGRTLAVSLAGAAGVGALLGMIMDAYGSKQPPPPDDGGDARAPIGLGQVSWRWGW